MSAVFLLHGVADLVGQGEHARRGLLERAAYERHLAERPRPFVDLDEAVGGGGDALTVDDATRASAEAARLARRYGHAVSLFVNPGHVEEETPYPLYLLNALLDAAGDRRVRYRGEGYALGEPRQKRALRRAVKGRLATLRRTERCYEVLLEVARALGTGAVELPPFLRTLTAAEVRELQEAGVRIENHGWTHLDPAAFDAPQWRSDVERGRRWIERRLGTAPTAYAVPFGEERPGADVAGPARTVLLHDDRLPRGAVAPGVVNRESLSLTPAGAR